MFRGEGFDSSKSSLAASLKPLCGNVSQGKEGRRLPGLTIGASWHILHQYIIHRNPILSVKAPILPPEPATLNPTGLNPKP